VLLATHIYYTEAQPLPFSLSFKPHASFFSPAGEKLQNCLDRKISHAIISQCWLEKYTQTDARRIHIYTFCSIVFRGGYTQNLSALTQFAPSSHFYLPAGILKGAKKQYAPSAANLLFECVNTMRKKDGLTD
jgi:hypothetical protein